MVCSKCGNANNEGQQHCNYCGAPLKKGSSISRVIIIVILVSILAIACLLFFYFSKNNKSSTTATTTTTTTTQETTTSIMDIIKDKTKVQVKSEDLQGITFKSEQDLERNKNIELAGVYFNGDEGHINVLLNNNSQEFLDITVYLNFYKDGKRINSKPAPDYYVKPNTTYVVSFTSTTDEEYDSIDLTYKTSKPGTYHYDVEYNPKNFTKVTNTDKYSSVIGTYKNTISEDLYAYASCLYYKNDKIVYATSGYISKNKDDSTVYDCSCYKYELPDNLDYDTQDFKIFSLYYTKGE